MEFDKGIIGDFFKYYEASESCYSLYKTLSDLTVLPKKVSSEIHSQLSGQFSLERSMAEFNLKDQLNEVPIENLKTDRVFPLDSSLKNQFELVYAVDFSNVLIHLGSEADQKAREHGADAVTQGTNIYFRSDQYQPHSKEGQELLAHELQHVQQFQSQKTMNSEEDILRLEDDASLSEKILSDVNLHALTKPVLSDLSQTGADDIVKNIEYAFDGSASQSDFTDSDESLDSFKGKRSQVCYRVFLESGKFYDFSQAEYEILLKNLESKMDEFLEEKKFQLHKEDYVLFMQKVTEAMKWSNI